MPEKPLMLCIHQQSEMRSDMPQAIIQKQRWCEYEHRVSSMLSGW